MWAEPVSDRPQMASTRRAADWIKAPEWRSAHRGSRAWTELQLLSPAGPARWVYDKLTALYRHDERVPPPQRSPVMGPAWAHQSPGPPSLDFLQWTSCCGLQPSELWGGLTPPNPEQTASPLEAAALALFESVSGLGKIEKTKLKRQSFISQRMDFSLFEDI